MRLLSTTTVYMPLARRVQPMLFLSPCAETCQEFFSLRVMPRGHKRKKKWHTKRVFRASNRCWGAKRSNVRRNCTQIQIIGLFWGLAMIHDYPEEGAILLRQRHTFIPERLLSKFRFTESSTMCRFGPGLGFGTHKNLLTFVFFWLRFHPLGMPDLIRFLGTQQSTCRSRGACSPPCSRRPCDRRQS